MKNIILTLTLFLISLTINSQGYISIAGGPSYKAGEMDLSKSAGAKEGSYGAGWLAQVRGGYFFNKMLGLEVGLGYLHGEEQTMFDKTSTLQATGKSRAYGGQISGIINFSEHIYIRAGLVMKLGGRNEFTGQLKSKIPKSGLFFTTGLKYLEGIGTMENEVPLVLDIKRNNYGKFPLGHALGLGFKTEIAKNLHFFAEFEYLRINVDGDKSELVSFNGKIGNVSVTRKELFDVVSKLSKLDPKVNDKFNPIKPLLADKSTFEEKPDYSTGTQLQATTSPYSSIGFALGLTYSFGN